MLFKAKEKFKLKRSASDEIFQAQETSSSTGSYCDFFCVLKERTVNLLYIGFSSNCANFFD